MESRREFGNRGEEIAAEYLVRKGMKVLARQARTHFGEIDLVCDLQGEVVFVEVKTRAGDEYGYPEESITRQKWRHMVSCAEAYIIERSWEGRSYRIDVVSISMKPGEEPSIVHFPAVDGPYGR